MVGESGRWRRVVLGLGLFLIVWGGKLAVIDRWGTDLPWWDDWSGIGANLIVPHARGELGPRHFFAPHHEHRIVWTRALDLALVLAYGQWDGRLECTASAAVHALVVVFAFFAGARVLSRRNQLLWLFALVALTAPPVVWENIVRGFDSQHYFLIGFSLAAVVGLMTAPAGGLRWWLGLVAAVAALFTMGSGLIAVAVVAVTLRVTTPRAEVWRRHRWTLFACVVVFLAGWLLRHEVPAHAVHRAQNTKEFTIAFWHHLQWPLVHHAWFGAITWLPWAWLTWRCVRRDPATGTGDRVVVALGLWALAHYAAMAWMRGHLQPWPPTRGLENVVVGLAVNLLALLLTLQRFGPPVGRKLLVWGPSLAGVAVSVYGLGSIIRENVSIVLPSVAAHARLVERNTRAFLATGDRAWLKPGEIPFPNIESYAAVLGLPEIQSVLPPSVRQPILIEGIATPPGSFDLGGVPGELSHPAGLPVRGSYTHDGLATVGEWRSAPVDPGRFAYWQFDVAGSLSVPGLALELATVDGRVTSRLPPRGTSAAVWTLIVVPAPGGPAVIVARDQSPGAWVAFTGPIEVTAGSMLARWLGHGGLWLAFAGLIVTAVGWRTCSVAGAGFSSAT